MEGERIRGRRAEAAPASERRRVHVSREERVWLALLHLFERAHARRAHEEEPLLRPRGELRRRCLCERHLPSSGGEGGPGQSGHRRKTSLLTAGAMQPDGRYERRSVRNTGPIVPRALIIDPFSSSPIRFARSRNTLLSASRILSKSSGTYGCFTCGRRGEELARGARDTATEQKREEGSVCGPELLSPRRSRSCRCRA